MTKKTISPKLLIRLGCYLAQAMTYILLTLTQKIVWIRWKKFFLIFSLKSNLILNSKSEQKFRANQVSNPIIGAKSLLIFEMNQFTQFMSNFSALHLHISFFCHVVQTNGNKASDHFGYEWSSVRSTQCKLMVIQKN